MEHVSKAQIKFVRSLQLRKFRDESGCFVAEGDKCISELRKTFELVLLADAANATESEIGQMSGLKTPQGSIAVFRKRTPNAKPLPLPEWPDDIILVLDGIQDPGNLGTIIRTCDWFGVRHVICSLDTVDCYNPKVVQATMGALARVKLDYMDLMPLLREAHTNNIPVYGTLLDGENMYSVLAEGGYGHGQSLIVMGNEGNGISPAVRECITVPLRIPSYPPEADTSESLNVAIATAVVLAEFRRASN